jgi:hypothetical protein
LKGYFTTLKPNPTRNIAGPEKQKKEYNESLAVN